MALKSTPTGTFSGRDYLGSEAYSMELVAQIRSYWAKLNKTPKVWVEREKYYAAENRPAYRYIVRSNLKLSV